MGQFHRSVHGSGHDDRCQHKHQPMEVPACQAHRWSCTNARRSSARWSRICRRVGRHRPSGGSTSHDGGPGDQRRGRRRRLEAPGPLRDRICAELRRGRSPAAIRADLAAEGVEAPPCVETVYRAIYSGALDVKPAECLRSRRRRRRCRQQRNPRSRPCGPNIAARPAAVNERAVAGHWEVDQIIGAYNRSSMIWLTERQSRYLIPVTMPDGYDADAVLAGLIEGLDTVPAHLRRHLTFDCGSEWANWRRLAGHYDLQVWFCDPHSPWQRGQIENQNRQVRWWFPRGTDLRLVTPAQAQHAANIINHQRRRSLHHQSPAELYAALTVQ